MTSIKFKQVTFQKCNILYLSYKGGYEIINTRVQEVIEDTKPYFQFSDLFGIYYDPKDSKHPENMEAVLGVIVKEL
jgi:hypothetical protein